MEEASAEKRQSCRHCLDAVNYPYGLKGRFDQLDKKYSHENTKAFAPKNRQLPQQS